MAAGVKLSQSGTPSAELAPRHRATGGLDDCMKLHLSGFLSFSKHFCCARTVTSRPPLITAASLLLLNRLLLLIGSLLLLLLLPS